MPTPTSSASCPLQGLLKYLCCLAWGFLSGTSTGELAPAGATLSQQWIGIEIQSLPLSWGKMWVHPCYCGPWQDWLIPTPAAVTCSPRHSVPAFFPALPLSPSYASFDCYPNKTRCSKIFVSGSTVGANPAWRLQNEDIFSFWVCARKWWELPLLLAIVIAFATMVQGIPYNPLSFVPFILSFIVLFSILFPSPTSLSPYATCTHIHIITRIHLYYYFLNHLRINCRLVPLCP